VEGKSKRRKQGLIVWMETSWEFILRYFNGITMIIRNHEKIIILIGQNYLDTKSFNNDKYGEICKN